MASRIQLLRERPTDLKNLKEQDEKERRKEENSYRIEDLMGKLNTINAARTVLTHGELGRIPKSVLLAPFSIMDEKTLKSMKRIYETGMVYTDISEKWRYALKNISREVKGFVEREFEYFETAMPGLTKESMYRIIYNMKKKNVIKANQRYIDGTIPKMTKQLKSFHVRNPERLYPLPIERYEAWAKDVYRKCGYPKMRKRIVNGVMFGNSLLLTVPFKIRVENKINGGSPFVFDKKSIRERWLGIRIQKLLPYKKSRTSLILEDETNSIRVKERIKHDKIY